VLLLYTYGVVKSGSLLKRTDEIRVQFYENERSWSRVTGNEAGVPLFLAELWKTARMLFDLYHLLRDLQMKVYHWKWSYILVKITWFCNRMVYYGIILLEDCIFFTSKA